jgi:hypothetical protein
MGQLKPGTTYIYERVDDTVYRRETGAGPGTRTEVGHDYKQHRDLRIQENMKQKHDRIMEDQLWHNIRTAAHTNPALQDILDHAIMLYHLTKTK